MITKIYLVLLIVTVASIGLCVLFEKENKGDSKDKEKYKKIMYILERTFNIVSCILLFLCYLINVYVYKTKYWGNFSEIALNIIIGLPVFIISLFIFNYLYNIRFKYFDSIRKIIEYIMLILIVLSIVYFIIWGIITFKIFATGKTLVQQDKQKNYKEYSYSINIVELYKVPPYANFRRYYIRVAPSIVYYYDIITKNGNTTTRILDGSKYYVEKDEDDKYADNPHIEVYSITKKYTNIYGEEREDFVTYEYTICVPENSIHYEENN